MEINKHGFYTAFQEVYLFLLLLGLTYALDTELWIEFKVCHLLHLSSCLDLWKVPEATLRAFGFLWMRIY